jgi:hypothetical protein
MADNFWTNSTAQDPKRAFRFTVTMTGDGLGMLWYAKSVTKPKLTVGEATHDFLNHKFYYPGKTTWDPVTLKLVDPISPDAAGVLLQKIVDTGYVIPAGFASLVPGRGLSNPSKQTSVEALGEVKIDQIDSEGNPIETWTLSNAWIKDVAFGDLDYTQEGLTEISMTVRYDWAIFNSPGFNQLFKPQ